ncbi:MAG: hypothetical protein AAF368_00970 [Planctomycetota bacterium]
MDLDALEKFLLAVLVLWAAAGFFVTVFAVVVARRQVGVERHYVCGGRRRRWLVAGLLLLVAAGVSLVRPGLEGTSLALALVALGFGVGISLIAPAPEDSTYGERGVRRGWQARRFDQLEGWRLTGEHLRFLVHGRLVAVEVPRAEHDALRARLLELCPEGMSSFKA